MYAVSFLVEIVAIHALLVCEIFGPKIRLCKFFDKSQVWAYMPIFIATCLEHYGDGFMGDGAKNRN